MTSEQAALGPESRPWAPETSPGQRSEQHGDHGDRVADRRVRVGRGEGRAALAGLQLGRPRWRSTTLSPLRSSSLRNLAVAGASRLPATSSTTMPMTLVTPPRLTWPGMRWVSRRPMRNATPMATNTSSVTCGRTRALPSETEEDQHVAAAGPGQQAGRAERGDGDGQQHPAVLADARRPVEQRRPQEDQLGVAVVVAVGDGDLEGPVEQPACRRRPSGRTSGWCRRSSSRW